MKITPKSARECLNCQIAISGRKDKKFCCDQCRFIYNNKRKEENKKENTIAKINQILIKNREILKFYNPEGLTILRKSVLINQGYDFRYFTSYYKSKAGNLYFIT
jgi:predicted nucleic acid-binding Zn ribbon protein